MRSLLRASSSTRAARFPVCCLWISILATFFLPGHSLGRIYIDINAPSVRKFNIAIPDFKNLGSNDDHPELATRLSEVISNDLDLSGYFRPMEKEAFLEIKEAFLGEKDPSRILEDIRFKDWTVIGAELLLKGGYTQIGRSLEVEIKLFDVFWGRLILGKRALGHISQYRHLMHRLGNDVIKTLTGHESIFLSKLAFVGTTSGHKEIYVCDYDGNMIRQMTADKSIALLPRWSPDGKKVMYNSYKDGGPLLYMKDIPSGEVKRISGRSGLNIGAAWAPCGSKVGLTLSRKGNPDIFIIDLNGKIMRRVTRHWGIDVSPAFSPDGNKITYVSNRSGSPQIYVLDLTTGKEERLTFQGKYNTSPAWSSLNRIAFASLDGGRFEIYAMDADGARFQRLTESQGNNEDPCWSPDGRYIVFSSNRAGRYHLYIMNANGQNQRRITFLKGDQTAPSWAP
jgi:TolB protein